MDTGHSHFESNKFTLDNLLIWKDFDLAKYPARTIKCVLYKPADTNEEASYEKNICLDTKFYFKDNLANLNFKCVLVEPLREDGYDLMASDELTWIVKIEKLNEETSINKLIIDHNQNELMSLQNNGHSKNFKSMDIRIEAGMTGVVKTIVKTNQDKPSIVSGSSSFSCGQNQNNVDSDAPKVDGNYVTSSINSFTEKNEDSKAKDSKRNVDSVSLPIMTSKIGEQRMTAVPEIVEEQAEAEVKDTDVTKNNRK